VIALPKLPGHELLSELCLEAANREGIQPFAIEKDYYLTRLIWALAREFGEALLLKGGTLISKVDLGYRRMSEDVDLVIPWDRPRSHKGINAAHVNKVARGLQVIAPTVGLRFESFDGERFEKSAKVIWNLPYESSFGLYSIDLEVALRPVLCAARRAPLRRLLADPLLGDYSAAYCWALDADEARAEKVRAAFTRDAIRDFFDLEQLALAGCDFQSAAFLSLVDRKLAEMKAPPVAQQLPSFGLTEQRRKNLEANRRKGLQAVVRATEESFDLDAMLARFDSLWGKRG
jgi:hypothetical protein